MQLTRAAAASLVGAGLLLQAPAGSGQVAEVDLRTQIFHEPSSTSKMTVYTPELNIQASPSESLRVFASYQADAVTGASEAIKARMVAASRPPASNKRRSKFDET